MTRRQPLRVGIVGCGHIAGPYARDIVAKPELRLVAATDLDPARATALTEQYGGTAVATLDDLLAEELDLVVNLTFQGAMRRSPGARSRPESTFTVRSRSHSAPARRGRLSSSPRPMVSASAARPSR
jgi:hypothetical protein